MKRKVKKERSQKITKKTGYKKDNGSHNFIPISIMIAIFAMGLTMYFKQSSIHSDSTESQSSTESKTSKAKRKKDEINEIIDANDIIPNESDTWNTTNPKLQQVYNFLSNYVCHDHQPLLPSSSSPYCHPLIQPAPQRRTHYTMKTKSNKRLKQGETVMVLPRHLLIWDLDAMRDETFVQKELFQARHGKTGNPIDSGGFLASFLLYKQKLLSGTWAWEGKYNKGDDNSMTDMNGQSEIHTEGKNLLEYLNILPTYEDLSKKHPVFWSSETITKLLGKTTISTRLIHAYKDMISSEYQAFSKSSAIFSNNIDEQEYTTMRVNVMSRSFGPGPPAQEESLTTKPLDKELEFYQKTTGVNLTKGCRAMSPILDMWDHHAKPNVQWMYVREQRAFVIKVSEKEIKPYQDIMVSYGMYTDSHLFAKFGFVNGDGSGHTEVSIATMHEMLDVGLGQQYSYLKQDEEGKFKLLQDDEEIQRKSLLQYLVSDDGYEECIEKSKNPAGYELKVLKYQHLKAIANKKERWIVNFQPRNETSKPSIDSSTQIHYGPPKFEPHKVQFDGSKIIPTCRLLALTTDDYEGNAIEVLKKALASGTAESFEVNRQSDELEYRALMWLARLTNMALMKYPSKVRSDMESLALSNNISFQSNEWNALQVRLGEMQTLESLRSIASSGTRHMLERIKRQKKSIDTPALHIRQKVCSFEHTSNIVDDSI